MKKAGSRCDIFCNVIDNFGDVGVSWRLARQLASEDGLSVRLWVDDLVVLGKLSSEVNHRLKSQFCGGIEICMWIKDFPEVVPAELVIEMFACELPKSYIVAMAQQSSKPVWINLEYLSAEDWVHGCHKLPSPHPSLPLVKYFFFPGFTNQTGGLILEKNLLLRRNSFQNDPEQQREFWQSIGMLMPSPGIMKISMFSYENNSIGGLFDVWSGGPRQVICLVPEGRILPLVGVYFGKEKPEVGEMFLRGNLRVLVLPFLEQERYDQLLWACDINFVRGEDSLVRAQWAGKPYIWQIYPQRDLVHLKKLQAFLILLTSHLGPTASSALENLWLAWNDGSQAGQAWPAFEDEYNEIGKCVQSWSQQLAKNNLALNLLDFCLEIGRMRALKIEGS